MCWEKQVFQSIVITEIVFSYQSLRKAGSDPILLLLCITVFLSYLPEAGQYSCIFVYLRRVSIFSSVFYGFTDSL